MSSASSSVYNSSNPSRRNIVNRKLYAPPQAAKVLSSGTQHNISNNSNNSTPGNPPKAKDFVIKQKVRREATNENEALG